jgi:hypothetical protein
MGKGKKKRKRKNGIGKRKEQKGMHKPGNEFCAYTISKEVLPTAPSPTVTILMLSICSDNEMKDEMKADRTPSNKPLEP